MWERERAQLVFNAEIHRFIIGRPEKNRNETLQEDINELERCLNGREISESPVQFTIPRSKYENLKAAIEESKAAIYVVFKDGIFDYAFSDNAQT